jgi:hypothetical protein
MTIVTRRHGPQISSSRAGLRFSRKNPWPVKNSARVWPANVVLGYIFISLLTYRLQPSVALFGTVIISKSMRAIKKY